MTSTIKSFRGKNKFLSNFYITPIEYEGIIYPSAEHAFQAAKTTNVNIKKEISRMPDCVQAKRYGKTIPIKINWNDIKLSIMEDIVRIKFLNPELKRMLLETGDKELIEGNKWGDTYWGQCNNEGYNHLGKILMKVRDELA